MTKPVADATIVGDLRDGTTFADHDRAYSFGDKDGKPFVTVTFGQAAPETFSVDYSATLSPRPGSGVRGPGFVLWRQLIRKRDHTFQPPVPENTVRFGIPNACTTCHDDRSPEWATRQMNEWWGDADRRGKAVTLADTMYRAGSGDVSTLPALARLAVNRSQGLPVRASAAEYIARLISEGRSDGAKAAKVTGPRIPDPVIPFSAERSGPWPALLPPSSDPPRSLFP